MHNPGFYKRMRPAYLPLPPNKRAKYFSFRRPRGYKQSPAWQEFRAMKQIASNPIIPNLRTGGFAGKELKYVDYSITNTPIGTNWTLLDPAPGALNAIAMGDSESQRIGRKVTNSTLHLRINVNNTSTVVVGRTIRVVIFKDTQTNQAAPIPTGVFDGTLNGFRNLEFTSRYRVLYDKTLSLNPAIASKASDDSLVGNSSDRQLIVNFRCPGSTLFSGTTADVSTITDNSYHIMACSDATGSNMFYTARFRFMG